MDFFTVTDNTERMYPKTTTPRSLSLSNTRNVDVSPINSKIVTKCVRVKSTASPTSAFMDSKDIK